MSKHKNWEKEEVEKLINSYTSKTKEEIMELLPNRNWQAIQLKASKNKLYRLNYFTKEEDSFIKENYEKMSYRKIGKEIGRSRECVSNRVREIGLKKSEKWTKKEISVIKSNKGKISAKKLSELIKRTKSATYHKIQELGLQLKTKRYENLSNEKILGMLKLVSQKIKRTPFRSELTSLNLPSENVFTSRFGSYGKACMLANLNVNKGFVERKISNSKNGEACFSLAERKITDFMIDNNISFVKEVLYSKILNDDKIGKIRCDWLLSDNTIVEYFGMERNKRYIISMNKKIKLCLKNKVNIIKIFEKDLNNLNNVFSKYV